MPITLPGAGDKIATTPNSNSENLQHFLLYRSDDVNSPVLVDSAGLLVQLAGSAALGTVGVTTVPTDPFGANADAGSTTGSISAKLKYLVATGIPITSIVPGVTATALGKAEDAAHASGDVGVMALAVRRDTAAASSGTTGDYEPLQTDGTGRLRSLSNLADIDGNILNFAAPAVLTGSPTTSTSAYTSGYNLWGTAPVSLASAAAVSGGTGSMFKINIIDAAAQSAAMDLVFYDRSVTLPAANAAWTVSDADSAYYVGHVSIAASDYINNSANSTATKLVSFPYSCNATTLYVAGIVRGTPTYAATSLTLKFHVYKD